ncbi:response regulator transcription factor [Streptomyces sp. NPDC001340]
MEPKPLRKKGVRGITDQSSPPKSRTGKGKTALPHRITSRATAPGNRRPTNTSRQPTAPGDPQGIGELTPRERQVLILLSTGIGNRSIAAALGIAERTVKAHLTSIMGKISVSSRTEAALFAYTHHQALTDESRGGKTEADCA